MLVFPKPFLTTLYIKILKAIYNENLKYWYIHYGYKLH